MLNLVERNNFSKNKKEKNKKDSLSMNHLDNKNDLRKYFISIPKQKFPHYNIYQRTFNQLEITMAVAGFKNDQIQICMSGSNLSIRGVKDEISTVLLHNGISNRPFYLNFELMPNVKPSSEAYLNSGLLTLSLIFYPSEEKSYMIPIRSSKTK